MKPDRQARDCLEDIFQSASKAVAFVEGMNFESFAADERTTFAVIRALEIMGEATKRIPPDIRRQHPEIPWRSMSGIRDKLIHEYIEVNLSVVWATVREDIPPLLAQLRRALDDSSGS